MVVNADYSPIHLIANTAAFDSGLMPDIGALLCSAAVLFRSFSVLLVNLKCIETVGRATRLFVY